MGMQDILGKNRKGLNKQQRLQKKMLEEDTERRVTEFEEKLPEFKKEYFALTRKHKIDLFIVYRLDKLAGVVGNMVPADISVQVEAEDKARVADQVVGAEEKGNGVVNPD